MTRTRTTRRWTAFASVAAVSVVGFGAYALAQEGPGYSYSGIPGDQLAEEKAAIEAFCPAEPPCRVVEVDADTEPASGGARPGQDLASDGQAGEACPEAEAAFAQAGEPVDAWIGRCPDREETERLIEVSAQQIDDGSTGG